MAFLQVRQLRLRKVLSPRFQTQWVTERVLESKSLSASQLLVYLLCLTYPFFRGWREVSMLKSKGQEEVVGSAPIYFVLLQPRGVMAFTEAGVQGKPRTDKVRSERRRHLPSWHPPRGSADFTLLSPFPCVNQPALDFQTLPWLVPDVVGGRAGSGSRWPAFLGSQGFEHQLLVYDFWQVICPPWA